MSYIGECKGTQTPDERRAEACRIVQILSEAIDFSDMTRTEQVFVAEMQRDGPVSPKQIYWLRDIKSKYAE